MNRYLTAEECRRLLVGLVQGFLSRGWHRKTLKPSLAALGGASVFSIMEAMGHMKIETSPRYVHWVRGLADSAVHQLGI